MWNLWKLVKLKKKVIEIKLSQINNEVRDWIVATGKGFTLKDTHWYSSVRSLDCCSNQDIELKAWSPFLRPLSRRLKCRICLYTDWRCSNMRIHSHLFLDRGFCNSVKWSRKHRCTCRWWLSGNFYSSI